MAAQSTLLNTTMNIRYKAGIDSTGKDIVKAKKFSNIKLTSTADELLFIGAALGSLMEYDFLDVVRSDDSILVNA